MHASFETGHGVGEVFSLYVVAHWRYIVGHLPDVFLCVCVPLPVFVHIYMCVYACTSVCLLVHVCVCMCMCMSISVCFVCV